MTSHRTLLADLIRNNYSGSTPTVLKDDEYREILGVVPFVKVYNVDSKAQMKGLGYGWRKVSYNMTVDIKGKNQERVETVKEGILDLLGKKCVLPFTGIDLLEFDEGVQHAAYSGFYWWTIDVKLWRIRKPTGRE